jgi:glycosyltransferase involved in cell wall biosynthesis
MQCDACEVSVVIPVYNSASTLERAVTSVSRQTVAEHEILIIDDASQDQSLALARQLALDDRRIRVIALSCNGGKAHAMNQAIREARGAWVAVLDADDWYESERLAVLLSAATMHRADLVADNQYFYDAAADLVVRTAFPVVTDSCQLTRQAFIAGCDPYAEFNYGMLKPIVRTGFIRRTGLAYRESARLSEDFLYLVEFVAAGGTGALVMQPFYNWTQSFGSMSRQWTDTGAGAWRYDFSSARGANSEVLAKLRLTQQHDLVSLLVARDRAYRNLQRLAEISRMRACGSGLSQLLVTAARTPSIWPLLARRVVERTMSHHTNASARRPIASVQSRT